MVVVLPYTEDDNHSPPVDDVSSDDCLEIYPTMT